jgi:hypothetical protein
MFSKTSNPANALYLQENGLMNVIINVMSRNNAKAILIWLPPYSFFWVQTRMP